MNIASLIDHTILRPDCTLENIKQICKEAEEFAFRAVCVPPYFVPVAARILKDSPVKVATVIGFPMGYCTTAAKVEEIKRAMNDGVDELDVVINIAALKNKDYSYLRNDIDSTTRAVHLRGKTIKLILETGLLTKAEIERLCSISQEVGVDFVKTSTGLNGEGASIEVVTQLRSLLPPKIKIKASGGIRTHEQAHQLIEVGADRLGTSASIQIIQGSTPA